MPRLSLVLVVHREQAYISEFAESVLGQGFEDIELVAIDDAAPGHAPELLDALAERDARVRVHRLPAAVDYAQARNLGLELATGDYVWFVNASDVLPHGALVDVAERLRATTPDVLLVHHRVTDALGRSRPGPKAKLLAAVAAGEPVTLDQRPAIADLAPRGFDKVFRRAHLRELGVQFSPGEHGELSVTWPALLAAERIAASPLELYERRPRANAPVNGPDAGSPLDLLERYDEVLAFAAESPRVPDERRRLVVPAMLRGGLALLGGLPEPQRRAFFARLAGTYRRHRRGDEPLAGGRVARLRRALVARNAYRAFGLLEAAVARRRALDRRRAALSRRRGRARREAMQQYYRTRRREPIDPNLAVFAAYWYRGYSCNPRAIYEAARELVPGFRGVWVVKRDAVDSVPAGVEYVIDGTREYYDLLARARYFVNNVNFPNHLVKREGTVHVMTHHGTPLKRMGLDLRDTPVAGRKMDFAALLRRCERWDYSVSSNPLSTLVWERVYPTRHETLEVGYPRNDRLATATDEDVEAARAALGIAPGTVAVLYAPTHREYQTGYVPTLDLAAFAQDLGPGYVVLARLHYFYGEDPVLRRLHREGRIVDVAAHPSVEELCLAADVLLTDYSSIMFDYAVLDRPIVIHAPDWEVYRATRGTYFDLMAEPPGTITRTGAELVEAFRSGAVADERAGRLRAAFRARYCALDDGHAAERVVRRVWLGERAAAAEPVVTASR
jgi:CDP-glycerol glycerophosphotransferase